ncbi:hypothetical protein TorRG33x02_011840 [Trema orientale]|uniref:Uncharacterized protein n=1 Tax=Trema orientale TaxID=63057 RepID=A0A2P5FZ96_TREOI|nr:hypothetical protein TorRG33x02_011840 [Trema orientale]
MAVLPPKKKNLEDNSVVVETLSTAQELFIFEFPPAAKKESTNVPHYITIVKGELSSEFGYNGFDSYFNWTGSGYDWSAKLAASYHRGDSLRLETLGGPWNGIPALYTQYDYRRNRIPAVSPT